jgi:hypothetical protein
MVRNDGRKVDFDIRNKVDPLMLNIRFIFTRKKRQETGLLTRKMNDCKAVEELICVLSEFGPGNPVNYNFALFGPGVSEGF